MKHAVLDSPLGDVIVVGDGHAVRELWLHTHGVEVSGERDDSAFVAAREQLGEYFAGQRQNFDLDLDEHGTAFQRSVWAALRRIPYGVTTSYGRLAETLGSPKAVRAVGLANGRNPISIITPCHRVIGANGSLTGYGGGLPAKRWLLDHEQAHREQSAQQMLPLETNTGTGTR